jgi:hypothetical protein
MTDTMLILMEILRAVTIINVLLAKPMLLLALCLVILDALPVMLLMLAKYLILVISLVEHQ